MTQEEKDLLLKDLCGRLQSKVMIYLHTSSEITGSAIVLNSSIYGFIEDVLNNSPYEIKEIKPYLRSLSSMTEEERNDFEDISHNWFYVNEDGEIYPMGRFTDSGEFEDGILAGIDYLIKNHYDFRGLIPKGLALEAPEGMY